MDPTSIDQVLSALFLEVSGLRMIDHRSLNSLIPEWNKS
jgi:hypothetical protein